MQRPEVATAVTDLLKVLGGLPTSASAPAAPPAVDPALTALSPAERWARYHEGLPVRSRRFLDLLEERGQLTVDEAVTALDLPGPKAMGGLTGAMRRWAPTKGVSLPFRAVKDGRGNRAWIWTGAAS